MENGKFKVEGARCVMSDYNVIRSTAAKKGQPMRDTLSGVSRITLFACGEFYCYAVIFGLRRVIFATRVFRRIEYHCEAKPCNITSRQGNITLRVREEYHF